MNTNQHPTSSLAAWWPPLLHAIPITLFILALFYYWFGVVNRCVIFLYGHLGARPFDATTTSRYWMSGLVATGAVMVLYTLANWVVGRAAAWADWDYVPPSWWRTWLLSAPPLALGVLLITMTMNEPVLPFDIASLCALSTLLGLAVALMTATLATQQPVRWGWLIAAGGGLTPSLLLLRAVELIDLGLVTASVACGAAIGGTLAGATWTVIVVRLYLRRHRVYLKAHELFIAALGLSYLFLPLVHHLIFTPSEFRYISNAENFFAIHWSVQIISLIVTGALAVATTKTTYSQPS